MNSDVISGILSSLPTQVVAVLAALGMLCAALLVFMPAPVAVPINAKQKAYKALWQTMNFATLAFGNNKTTIASVHSGEVVPIEVHQSVVNALDNQIKAIKVASFRK